MVYIKHLLNEIELALILTSLLFLVTALMILSVKIIGLLI